MSDASPSISRPAFLQAIASDLFVVAAEDCIEWFPCSLPSCPAKAATSPHSVPHADACYAAHLNESYAAGCFDVWRLCADPACPEAESTTSGEGRGVLPPGLGMHAHTHTRCPWSECPATFDDARDLGLHTYQHATSGVACGIDGCEEQPDQAHLELAHGVVVIPPGAARPNVVKRCGGCRAWLIGARQLASSCSDGH